MNYSSMNNTNTSIASLPLAMSASQSATIAAVDKNNLLNNLTNHTTTTTATTRRTITTRTTTTSTSTTSTSLYFQRHRDSLDGNPLITNNNATRATRRRSYDTISTLSTNLSFISGSISGGGRATRRSSYGTISTLGSLSSSIQTIASSSSSSGMNKTR
ncbi:hypothetical protein FRACYDRAFT_243064 [Fragilariopsis cylindrus CCMP1102]|uniref:Uncharacterized protein n=1 Tax=Fragilariopsis cylindrus CCMP1102 TaxID=635003 RepID=A0A1E7F4U9_9STRA|nr:hypothetical protein FRACYDRAFT_243064 [Fragilariopsis cylindrus CCMP1102]|eukprot:OEU13177.1 hypothetical protein FRACYDRAFT_243064 [Fragilariopsis cylindrus CCMP1102]